MLIYKTVMMLIYNGWSQKKFLDFYELFSLKVDNTYSFGRFERTYGTDIMRYRHDLIDRRMSVSIPK